MAFNGNTGTKTEQMKKVYAVIVTYNAMPWIDRCLGSLKKSEMKVSAVVVDNNSKDGTVDHIRKHWPDTKLFVENKNHGFGQANNIGIRHALEQGADYILLLNQDAWIAPDMLTELIPHDDGRTVLSSVHLNGAGDALDKNFKYCSVERSGHASLLQNDTLLQTGNALCEADEICAACWLLPRNVVEMIGGFNPLFFHYSEDVNYQHRIHYHGMRMAWKQGTYVCHDRAFRPRQKVKYILVRQELVLRAADINQSVLKAVFCNMRYAMGVLHSAFIYREPQAIWYLIKALFYVLWHCREIGRSRKTEKTLGRHWL